MAQEFEDIEIKEDSPEKLSAVAGKPTKNFLFSWEFNKLIAKLRLVVQGYVTQTNLDIELDSVYSEIDEKQDFLTAVNAGAFEASLAGKNTLQDSDIVSSVDNVDGKLRKTSWLNVWTNFIKSKSDLLYQSILISGTNIKTINGTSILGYGNLLVSGGGAETFTIVYDGSEFYNTNNSALNTIGNFYTNSKGAGWNVIMATSIGTNPITNPTGAAHVLAYRCKLKGVKLLIDNSTSTSRDYELRVFASEATLAGEVNSQILISSRPNVGVVAAGAITTTVIDFNVGTQPTLEANTLLRHAIASMAAVQTVKMSIIYTFEKV